MVMEAEVRRLQPFWAQFFAGADVVAMGRDVLRRFAAARQAWGLGRLEPLGGGVVALVAGDAEVVLKVLPRGHAEDASMTAEGVAMAHWAAAGLAPVQHGRRDGGLTLLMERVRPGLALDALEPAPSPAGRLATVAGAVRELHALAPPASGIPRLADVVPHWRRTLADAPGELDALLADGPAEVLVHGDLHGGNLLRAGDGWQVIDPHATLADPHVDVWALLDPRQVALEPAALPRHVERYAAAAGLDPARAARWVRLRATIEARDIAAQVAPDPDDARWAAWLRAVVAALS